MAHMNWRAWLAILVTALGLYWVGRWQGAASVADAAAVSNAEQVLKLKQPYLAHLATLQRTEQQALRTAQVWRQRADSLRQIAARVDTVQLQPDSGARLAWRQVADAEHQSASACFVSLAACQARADTAVQRAAVLDSSLARLLGVKECRWLWFHCPSRTAALLIGSGLGLAGGVWISQR